IRRLLVEVPIDCPIASADVAWAMSGQVLAPLTYINAETGEVFETLLVVADDAAMLDQYGVGAESRRWRTVTPVALLVNRPRGKLRGSARARLEERAARALAAAAEEAGLPAAALIAHTRREPFHAKGIPAGDFHRASRADRAVLHAELIFAAPVRG